MSPSLKRTSCSTVRHFSFRRERNSRFMAKCLNSSCCAFSMIARASGSFSRARRCSYQSIASASSMTLRILRWGGPIVWLAAFAIFWLERGLPLSRDMLVMWILLGLLALSLTNVKGWVRSVVLEWLPFLAILWVYDLLRGQADGLFFQAHVLPQLRADEVIGLGVAPTVRLQHWLWDGAFTIHWYDYL